LGNGVFGAAEVWYYGGGKVFKEMDMRWLVVLVVLLGVGVLGCSVRVGRVAGEEICPGEVGVRLRAAEGIRSFGEKDRSLSGVAEEAAGVGEVDCVLRALSGMSSGMGHDSAAYKCVDLLVEQGLGGDATRVADTMVSITMRDAALAKIAGMDK
jgi:hypothetical protein